MGEMFRKFRIPGKSVSATGRHPPYSSPRKQPSNIKTDHWKLPGN